MLPLISRTHFYGVRAVGGIAWRHINREISVTSVGRALVWLWIHRQRLREFADVTAKRSPLDAAVPRQPGQSSKPLPRGLARDTQRGSNLRPTHLARSKKVNHRLELITLALHRLLDWSKSL